MSFDRLIFVAYILKKTPLLGFSEIVALFFQKGSFTGTPRYNLQLIVDRMGNFSNLLLELVDCWKHGVTGTIAIVLMELKNRNLALTAGIAVGVKSQVVFNSLYSLLTSLMKLTLTCVWRVWKMMFKVSANFKNHEHLKDHILKIFKVAYTTHTVKPLIKNTSKEFIKCRILHFLMLECCRYLVFS